MCPNDHGQSFLSVVLSPLLLHPDLVNQGVQQNAIHMINVSGSVDDTYFAAKPPSHQSEKSMGLRSVLLSGKCPALINSGTQCM